MTLFPDVCKGFCGLWELRCQREVAQEAFIENCLFLPCVIKRLEKFKLYYDIGVIVQEVGGRAEVTTVNRHFL